MSSSSAISRFLLFPRQRPVVSSLVVWPSSRRCCLSNQANSGKQPYFSHEYPWAKEPPIITRTTAKEALQGGGSSSSETIQQQPPHKKSSWFSSLFSSSRPPWKKEEDTSMEKDDTASTTSTSSTDTTTTTTTTMDPTQQQPQQQHLADAIEAHGDPFDDTGKLTDQEVQELRHIMKKAISTQVKLTPITPTPLIVIPKMDAETPAPETIITQLDNGIRVVTQETYGQVSTVGIVTNLGSRQENHVGITNLIEMLGFGATKNYPEPGQIQQLLTEWGANPFVSTGRDQSIHCIDILRPNVDKAIGLLGEVFCNSLFLEQDVEMAKQTMELLRSLPETFPPELQLQECLMMAAYGEDQQLGKPHVCPAEYIPLLNAQKAMNYWKTQVLDNPHNMVVGGAGVEHDHLCRLVETYFGHLRQNNEMVLPTIPSQYRGGSKVHALPWPEKLDKSAELFGPDISAAEKDQRLTRVVLGLEVGGWHAEDLVAVCVLQTLLGGGSSFSAGGPGKGMYSRLYRKVLNSYRHVESAESFTAFHGETGLWGISGSIRPSGAKGLLQTFCQQLKMLTVQPVTEEEIVRARNMLKGNVLTQLESRLVIFEDISRQVLTYGKRESAHDTCIKIDAVTKEDLMRVATKAMEKPPTMAAVGIDVSNVPEYEEVKKWFQ